MHNIQKIVSLVFQMIILTQIISFKWIVRVYLEICYSDASCITCGVLQEPILRPLLFLLYVNDKPQAVKLKLVPICWWLFPCFSEKGCYRNWKTIKWGFTNICKWLLDDKIRIHFGRDKTKSIFSTSKLKIRKVSILILRKRNLKKHSKGHIFGLHKQ